MPPGNPNGPAGYHGPVADAAIDFHVHLPTPDWLDGSMAGYVEAAEAYFRSPVQRGSLADLAARYRVLNVRAVLLAWASTTCAANTTSRATIPPCLAPSIRSHWRHPRAMPSSETCCS